MTFAKPPFALSFHFSSNSWENNNLK